MGMYLNPGNSGFEMILNDEYIDKTGLIDLINQSINTPRMLSCISRPRRLGKSLYDGNFADKKGWFSICNI